jgi:hypothetical protein
MSFSFNGESEFAGAHFGDSTVSAGVETHLRSEQSRTLTAAMPEQQREASYPFAGNAIPHVLKRDPPPLVCAEISFVDATVLLEELRGFGEPRLRTRRRFAVLTMRGPLPISPYRLNTLALKLALLFDLSLAQLYALLRSSTLMFITLYRLSTLALKLALLFDISLKQHYALLRSSGQTAFTELAQHFLLHCRLPGGEYAWAHTVLCLPSPLRCHSAL